MKLFLPKDTLKVGSYPDNLALALQRYIYWQSEKKDAKYKAELSIDAQMRAKKQWPELLQALETRSDTAFRALEAKGMLCKEFSLSSERLIVGLGQASPTEISIALDHIYGIPYIPTTTLKGCVRSWMIKQGFGVAEDDLRQTKDVDPKALLLFFCLFGSLERKGAVHFFDAYPTSVELVIDYMTPHYTEYYQMEKNKKSEKPLNQQSKTPIPFWILRNSCFKFRLAIMPGALNLSLGSEKVLLETAEEWTKDALMRSGIGAKSTVGYGFFQEEAQSS